MNEKKKNGQNSNIFVIHMNEMVEMKTSATPQSYNKDDSKWKENKSSTFKWKKECIDGFMKYYKNNSRWLLKLIVTCISVALIGFVVTSLLNPADIEQPLNKTHEFYPAQESVFITSQINNSFLTTDKLPSTFFNLVSSQKTQPEQNFNRNDSKYKNNVERINFNTTSNKILFSVIPTLPPINKKKLNMESTSEDIAAQNRANDCQSTTPLCQELLSYDLTDSHAKWNLTIIEYQHFEHLLKSNCSNRAAKFVCQNLEPECRSEKIKHIKPCRRVCKGIFESCSHIIASSEVLTEFFDCNRYVDSDDESKCEDITRTHNCFDDEFQCSDFSCIPIKWRCDNIRDCTNGDDETECKFCNYDEFKCLSDQECISEKWFCDGNKDCSDGSDESECNLSKSIELNDFHEIIMYEDSKNDYNQDDHDHDTIVSVGDEVVPIFVNPNSTTSGIASTDTSDLDKEVSKRFRSTMRTMTSTSTGKPKQLMENSTSINKRVTSHNSPCPEDYLRCVDGLCITLDQICDKVQDCSDNSDELHCE